MSAVALEIVLILALDTRPADAAIGIGIPACLDVVTGLQPSQEVSRRQPVEHIGGDKNSRCPQVLQHELQGRLLADFGHAVELGRADTLGVPPQYERGWNTLAKLAMDTSIAAPMPAL